MGTMNGLETPLFGAFKHYSEAQVEKWSVDDGGQLNMTFANPGADNAIAITITDSSSAFITGYLQGYYVSITTSSAASYTTGSSQINGVGIDMFLGGTIGCEASGIYVYIAAGTSPSMAAASIAGLDIYIDDLGTNAVAVKSGITIHMADNSSSGYPYKEGMIFFKHESSSRISSLFAVQAANNCEPSYFLSTNFAGGKMIQSWTCGGTTDKVLVCYINGSTYWIPLYQASA